MVRMGLWAIALGTTLLLAGLSPATAQTGTVLAVADFADDATDGGALIQASQLSLYLQQRLQALAGDRLQVVASEKVRAVMRAQGATPFDLLTRSRAVGVATAVGASQIVTGRWWTLSLAPAPENPSGAAPRGAEPMATATLNIWVTDAAAGIIILQATYVGRASGLPGHLALLQAAYEALDQAAIAIAHIQ